jgi:hypothetical protein
MKYENLPIYKSAMEFCIYMASAVIGFEKYHKYTIGKELFCLEYKTIKHKEKR